MKKIVDWTFGSVFRTFGRIIAYLIFGIAISYLLSSLDFRISDLFLDNVKADTFTSFNTNGVNSSDWSNSSLNNYVKRSYNNNANVNHAISFNNNITKNSIQKIQINGYFRFLNLDNWVSDYECVTLSTTTPPYCIRWKATDNDIQELVFQIFLDNKTEQCIIDWNLPNLLVNDTGEYIFWSATCYTHTINQMSYVLQYYNEGYASSVTFEMGIAKIVKYWESDSSAIIDNQNQNTQTIVEQQQNSTQQILDSNTTQAESDAEGFFGDFDVPDVGGLSAIITAPLNTIRSLLSSSCSELVLPLPYVDEDLRLPCMNSIYTEHFGLFFNLYQTIILAIIAYRCIRSIYFDITGFTNPDDDRIEVMDL